MFRGSVLPRQQGQKVQQLPEFCLEVQRRDRQKTIHFWHVVAPALAVLACVHVRILGYVLLTRFCIPFCWQLCGAGTYYKGPRAGRGGLQDGWAGGGGRILKITGVRPKGAKYVIRVNFPIERR